MIDVKQFAGHTPGPWKVTRNGKSGGTYRIWRNDPDQPNETNNGYACISSHISTEPNARLCAAAPSLLAEVERLQARVSELEAALRWYASHEAWTAHEIEGPDGDYGKRARAALETPK
jgi:hypothetical protein